MYKKLLLTTLLGYCLSASSQSTEVKWNTPSAGNPFIPGYFADPTIRKFGDTYYIYATTDGTGNGYGPAQVWMSKDFVNWRNVLLNWPTTEVVWAPDVVQQPDGSYRYYYCTPCEVRVGESNSPTGPWTNRLGASDAVLVPDRFVHNAITLDPQLFRDDDGSEYLYFGTWGIYKDFGCGVAKLAEDGKSFTDKKLILNTEIIDFFEAPFVFKKNGIYYFTYSSGSCHDDTYRVQYAISKDGPMGPYEYKGCILKTNADGTIHGPGHHSILQDGNNYYIVYHRHNNPHAIHGFHRQICIDKMEFDADGNILPIKPTHDGIIPASLAKNAKKNQVENLAFDAKVTASSTYSEWFKPEYAVDDNNGTLWRAASAGHDWRGTHAKNPAWLQLDLGEVKQFNEIFTQFEYATFFYQYKIEISNDGTNWTLFADKTQNTQQGSPMIDVCEGYQEKGVKAKPASARYIRITITDTQKNGHFPAIWNVKVYRAKKNADPLALLPQPELDESAILAGYPWIHKKDIELSERNMKNGTISRSPLFSLDASNYQLGSNLQGVSIVPKDGKAAFHFDGQHTISMPCNLKTLTYNAPYTVAAWILNPDPSEIETVAQFMPAGNDLATIELRNGTSRAEGIIAHNASFENAGAPQAVKANTWQHWVVNFDGFNERIYCDGKLVSEKNIFLMLRPAETVTIGASSRGSSPFTGYLHSLRLYDYAFSAEDILAEMKLSKSFSNEELAKMAETSPLRNQKLSLQVSPLSPNLVEATICDETGKALESGIYDFTFASGNNDTSLHSSQIISQSSTILSVDGASVYAKVKDVFGYEVPILSQKLKINKKQFTDVATSIQAKAKDGIITLESKGSNLGADPATNGPIESVEVDGDFILQCKVTGLTGAERRNTPAYNEGGILLQRKEADGTQSLIQLGVFPLYNCGNMLTVVSRRLRPQYPNNKGWNYDPFLQIQRINGKLKFLTSADGKVWTEMNLADTRMIQSFCKGALNVGIYQTTYSDNQAAVSFSDIHIWQKK